MSENWQIFLIGALLGFIQLLLTSILGWLAYELRQLRKDVGCRVHYGECDRRMEVHNQKIKELEGRIHKSFICLMVLSALFLLAGCTTQSTICEFDKDTGAMTKKTVTERDPFDKITDSTKDKSVLFWEVGWFAFIKAIFGDSENPTPTGEIYAGKRTRAMLTLHKDQKNAENIALIVAAMREDISIDFSGIKSTGSNIEMNKNSTQNNQSATADSK